MHNDSIMRALQKMLSDALRLVQTTGASGLGGGGASLYITSDNTRADQPDSTFAIRKQAAAMGEISRQTHSSRVMQTVRKLADVGCVSHPMTSSSRNGSSNSNSDVFVSGAATFMRTACAKLHESCQTASQLFSCHLERMNLLFECHLQTLQEEFDSIRGITTKQTTALVKQVMFDRTSQTDAQNIKLKACSDQRRNLRGRVKVWLLTLQRYLWAVMVALSMSDCSPDKYDTIARTYSLARGQEVDSESPDVGATSFLGGMSGLVVACNKCIKATANHIRIGISRAKLRQDALKAKCARVNAELQEVNNEWNSLQRQQKFLFQQMLVDGRVGEGMASSDAISGTTDVHRRMQAIRPQVLRLRSDHQQLQADVRKTEESVHHAANPPDFRQIIHFKNQSQTIDTAESEIRQTVASNIDRSHSRYTACVDTVLTNHTQRFQNHLEKSFQQLRLHQDTSQASFEKTMAYHDQTIRKLQKEFMSFVSMGKYIPNVTDLITSLNSDIAHLADRLGDYFRARLTQQYAAYCHGMLSYGLQQVSECD